MSLMQAPMISLLHGQAASACDTVSACVEGEAGPVGRAPAEVEDLVREIWEDVLEIRPIGNDTSFHLLNRGMRRALVILQRLEAATSIELPLSIFSAAPTISGMAEAVRTGGNSAFTPIVEMKKGEGASPLFFIPGLGGVAFELFHLVEALDYPGSIYSLQAKGLDGQEAPHYSIGDMARSFARTLRSVQPEGPYTIVGYCLGGCIALEVARLLTAAGQRMNFLGIIEPPLHEKTWPLATWLNFKVTRAIGRAGTKTVRLLKRPAKRAPATGAKSVSRAAARADGSRHASEVLSRQAATSLLGLQDLRNTLTQRFRNGSQSVLLMTSPYYTNGLPRAFQKVRDAQIISFIGYKPDRYAEKVTCFTTPVGNTLQCDPRVLWPRFIPNIEWRDFTGDHQAMLRHPHAENNAHQLLACLMRSCS